MTGNDLLFPQILSLHAKWLGSHPAAITAEGTLTWAALMARAHQVAQGLIAQGLTPGDRVGLVMGNGPAFLEVLIGTLAAGGVATPLNTTIADDAIAAMLADASVAAIFASSSYAPRIPADCCPGALRIADGGPVAGWLDFRSWAAAFPAVDPALPLKRSDLCNIIYSSGTTGRPKGICHDHGGRLDWAHDLGAALRYHSGARTLFVTGLFSNISWAGMLPTWLCGGTMVVKPAFDAGGTLAAMDREGVTHVSMVPVQFQRIAEHPDFAATNRAGMAAMMCCGSPLPVALKETLFREFPCGVIELYGLTEGLITTLAPEDAPGRMASVGRPLPGEDLMIVDGNDLPVPAGQAGEIVALSRFAMAGYWNNPAATAETFLTDGAGRRWLRSGDIGRLDDQGFLFITDRKKDMILSGGQNIYPADIEAVLITHPDVADCAVIAVPSAQWGETPLGLVVLKPGAAADAGALKEWVNARLGKQQRLSAIEFRADLARNANGKILKRELRAPYWPQ